MSTTTDQSERIIQEDIERVVEVTGRTYIRLVNTWWGSEKFGSWNDEWLVTVKRETDKALLLHRVVPASSALRRLGLLREVDGDEDDVAEQVRQGRLEDIRDAGWGEPRDRARGGWVPKSAIDQMETAPGPEEFQVFPADGSGPEVGSADDADVVIREEFISQGNFRQYRKLAVDADKEMNEQIYELEWDEWHVTYEFSRDDTFMCMSVDNDPEGFAEEVNDMGYSIAVHEDLLDE